MKNEKSALNEAVSVKSSFLSGAWGGLPLVFSLDELPVDQRLEDSLSECWETTAFNEPVSIVGYPEVRLQLSSDRPCALVAARLCDVFADGESALISRGIYKRVRLPRNIFSVLFCSFFGPLVYFVFSHFPIGKNIFKDYFTLIIGRSKMSVNEVKSWPRFFKRWITLSTG